MEGVFEVAGIGEATVGVTTGYGSKPHFHEGYSLGLFHAPTRISLRGGFHDVGPDRVVVLEPFEPHGGGRFSKRCRQDGLVIDPALIAGLFGSKLPVQFRAAVIDDSDLYARFASGLQEQAERQLRQAIIDLFVEYGSPAGDGPARASAPSVAGSPEASISQQAQAARLSRSHYSRKVRAQVGLAPRDYRRQQRVLIARALIEQGRDLAEAAAEAGFADQAHMTRLMRTILGVTPGALRRGNR
jgi:AraC-like DNA-binding protein